MRGYLRIRYAVYLIIGIAVSMLCKKGIDALRADQHIVCMYDKRIADAEQQKIKSALHALYMQGELSAQALHMYVPQYFPFIKSFAIQRIPGAICCSFKTRKPFCLVNNNLVLTIDGVLVGQQVFEPEVLAGLKTAYISESAIQKEYELSAFQVCMSHLPEAVLNVYDLVWHDAITASLRDKEQKNFSIFFNAETLPTLPVLTGCNVIKKNLIEKNLMQRNKHWVADIRFTNQIIVFEDKGGRRYG